MNNLGVGTEKPVSEKKKKYKDMTKEEKQAYNRAHYEKYYGAKIPEDMPPTVAQFARQHGYHPSMGNMWVRKHRFPAVKIGNRWYIMSEEKALAFLNWYQTSRQKNQWADVVRE